MAMLGEGRGGFDEAVMAASLAEVQGREAAAGEEEEDEDEEHEDSGR